MVDLGQREETGNCAYFFHSNNDVSLDGGGKGMVSGQLEQRSWNRISEEEKSGWAHLMHITNTPLGR